MTRTSRTGARVDLGDRTVRTVGNEQVRPDRDHRRRLVEIERCARDRRDMRADVAFTSVTESPDPLATKRSEPTATADVGASRP